MDTLQSLLLVLMNFACWMVLAVMVPEGSFGLLLIIFITQLIGFVMGTEAGENK